MSKLINQLIITVIPATCPFAKTIKFAGFSVTIPPLCKLNPFYNQLMQLRLNASNHLANLEIERIMKLHNMTNLTPVQPYPESNIY